MPTLNLFSDLNKLTSSPMKLPMGVPAISSYPKNTDTLAPCIHHHHHHELSSSSPPVIPLRINSDSQHEKIIEQQSTMTPQRLSSSSSSSTSTPTSSFMAKGAPNSQSSQSHYRRVFSFWTKHPSKDAPLPTTTPSTTRQIKKKKSLVGTASWIMFKKSSNRSPSTQHQQQQQHRTSSSIGGNGVFVSADEPLVPGTCTCTDPTTLKMDRTKQSYDSFTMTTTTTITAATAAATTKHEHPPSGILRTLPSLLSGDTMGSGISNNNSKKKRSKRKVYDPAQWPCALVQDTIEQDRLVAQHYLLRMAFNGDHHAPVQYLLSQRQQHHALLNGSNNNKTTATGGSGDGKTTTSISLGSAASSLYNGHDNNYTGDGGGGGGPVVLDVGCGLGQWSMEMATVYPKSTFIGIDILPTFPKDIKPRNCHFIQANVKHLPLPFADHSIDFIYQRDLNWGLVQDDWYPLIKEYLRILKPGGWIELVEADLETKSSLEKECAMNDKLLEGFCKRRQDPFVARRLPTMLAVHGFRRVESHFQSLPLGWKNNISTQEGSGVTSPYHQHLQPVMTNNTDGNSSSTPGRQVQAMASQYLFYLRSLGPWLRLVMGLSQAKYIDYVDQLPLEWEQAQTYVNWHCATAQKPYE